MNEKKINLLTLENGIIWPYCDEKKALSFSSLTKILRDIFYEEIPKIILLKAAERGKIFHGIIQDFIENNKYPDFEKLKISNDLNLKIKETIDFLDKKKIKDKLVGSEILRYTFYKNNLIATYIDLEFNNSIIELKTNSYRMKDNKLSKLLFKIQLLIQYLCTLREKNLFLLWSTGKGVIFKKFRPSENLFKILDILIDLFINKEKYSLDFKRKIIENLILIDC